MARLKEKVFPTTIALTQEQKDYLRRKPNASALVRKILDDLMSSEQNAEGESKVLMLSLQLKELQRKLDELREKRSRYFHENEKHWRVIRLPGWYVDTIDWADKGAGIPKPLDDEDSRVAFRILQGYDEKMNLLLQEIGEIKKKILES